MGKRKPSYIKRLYSSNTDLSQMVILAIVVYISMGLLIGGEYFSASNLKTILSQLPQYGIMTMSVVIAMLLGGFDLSAVSLANLSTVVAANLMVSMVADDMPPGKEATAILISIAAALVIGVLGGALNGVIIAQFKVPAMLATLGTGIIFKGIAVIITKGRAVSGLPSTYSRIASYNLFGFIPVIFLIFVLCVALLCWVFSRTAFGKQVRMIGANKVAAFYSGVKVKWVTIKAFMLGGIMSVIGGLVMLSRNNSAKADYGDSYTLICVMIAILGGINPDGSKGSYSAVAVAIIVVQMISSAINMYPDMNNYFTKLIWGSVLIGVMLLRKLRKK